MTDQPKQTVSNRTSRRVLLAKPRGYCAGVDRAVQAVEMALDKFGPPVYVRRQIVHNTYVVSSLEKRGAIFVTEVGEVPPGAVVVFSAHGIAPEVRRDAEQRGGPDDERLIRRIGRIRFFCRCSRGSGTRRRPRRQSGVTVSFRRDTRGG